MRQIKYICIALFLCPYLSVQADVVNERTVTVSPPEIHLTGVAGTPLRVMVKIIPEIKYPFNIKKIYAESGKDIRYRLKTVNDPVRKSRHVLFVENIRQAPGKYTDVIHIVTDNKTQPEIDIMVYADISGTAGNTLPAAAPVNHDDIRSKARESRQAGKKVLQEQVNIINIRFASGSSSISEPSGKLARIAGALKSRELKHARILIQGHTDNIGSSDSNLALSVERANNVMNLLVDMYGVDKKRLSVKGLGEAMPVTSNATPSGRALNRRIEFVYLGPWKK